MKFMFVNFKSEIIDFLLEEDGELYDNWGNSVISVVHIAMHNRLDLCEIVFSETDKFNKITDSIDLAADNGNFQVVKYLTSKGVSCTTKAMDWAASKGHFKLFKWLHLNRSEGCTGGSLGFASINGFLEIVKYIIENRLVSGRMQLNQSLEKAKFKGRLNVVEYLESVLEMTV